MKMYHGFNLLPEGLETGEFKVGGTAEFDELETINVLAYTRNPYTDGFTQQVPAAQGIIINGVPNGMFFAIASNDMIQGLLQTINNAGHGDAIMSVFTVPILALVGFNGLSLEDLRSSVLLWIVNDFKANPITKNLISTPQNLDGYIPRNQKLRTYPYIYLGFNPPNGSSKIFRYEDFLNGTPSFKMYSEITPNPSVVLVPKNYRGNGEDSLQDSVTINGYPTIGWITEYFNTWLAQNSQIINVENKQREYNTEVAIYKSGVNMLGDIATMARADASGLSSITSNAFDLVSLGVNYDYYIQQQMAQKEKQQMLPNSGNLSSSNATLLGYNLIDINIFNRYTIKYQFAERIDKYFDMYGYLTNKIKVPNINNRPNWNYVKTIGCNITANIPQEDLLTIKNIFDNGVTLWHNTNTFLDYSQNNR